MSGYLRLRVLLVCVLVSGCATMPSKFSQPATVTWDEDGIVYKGVIDARYVLEAIRLAEMKNISTLKISSGGGDVEAGIELGYWIRENNIEVIIDGVCFSSCANYVFTAANKVVVKSGAIVGWHGGAFQKGNWYKNSWYEYLIPNRVKSKSLYVDSLLEFLRVKEKTFFGSIGVDRRITTFGQTQANTCRTKKSQDGWVYRLSDLEKMGITNVVLEDGEFVVRHEPYQIYLCLMPPIEFGD